MIRFWWYTLASGLSTLRGGAQFWQLFGGLIIGLTLGLMPELNILSILLIIVLLIININGWMALISYLVALLAANLFAEYIHDLGIWVLDNTAMKQHITTMLETPWVALMGFDCTSQIGAMPLWCVGVAAGIFLCGWMTRIRERPVDDAIFWLPVVGWLLREMLNTRRGIKSAYRSTNILTINRLMTAAIVIPLLLMGGSMRFTYHIRHTAQEAFYLSDGFQLGIKDVDINWSEHTIELENVTVFHPDEPEYYLFWTNKVTMKFRPDALSLGRLHVTQLTIDGALIDYPLTAGAEAEQRMLERSMLVPSGQLRDLSPAFYQGAVDRLYERMAHIDTYLQDLEAAYKAQDSQRAHALRKVPVYYTLPRWSIDQVWMYNLLWLHTMPMVDAALYDLSSARSSTGEIGVSVSVNPESFDHLKAAMIDQINRTKRKSLNIDQLERNVESWFENLTGFGREE